MKISVIIPVYNVEKYLRQCLDSVLAQTTTDIEIILVDDGSTDTSIAIMDEYAGRDSRIQIIHRKRSNAGACRNVGLHAAQGEYLSFLDSDDVFSPYLLEVLLDGMMRFDADVSCCRYIEFIDGEELPVLSTNKDLRWNDITLDCPGRADFDAATSCTWNKLYRRKYIEDAAIEYVEQPTTNDATFVWAAVANASKVVSTDAALVAYRRRTNSIQDKKSSHPECDIIANIRFSEEMKRLGVFERRPWIYDHYRLIKPSSYLEYLSTMRNRRAYMIAYNLLREDLLKIWTPEALLRARNDRFTRRASGILRNSLKEKWWRSTERTLSPLLGQYNYSTGFKHNFIYALRCVILLVFDFIPTIKHIPVLIGRQFR